MVQYATYSSPFGPIQIGHRDGMILSIRCGRSSAPHQPSDASEQANIQLQEYWSGKRKTFDLPIQLEGTPFQISVWKCLQTVPYGEVRTYRQIATAIGSEKACRAVGQAVNRNPIWIVVPCHRIVGSNRALTGYAGGLSMKSALLDLEQGIIHFPTFPKVM